MVASLIWLAALGVAALVSGCGGRDEEETAEIPGRPEQDPVVPKPEDVDPCAYLWQQAAAAATEEEQAARTAEARECEADKTLPRQFMVRLEAGNLSAPTQEPANAMSHLSIEDRQYIDMTDDESAITEQARALRSTIEAENLMTLGEGTVFFSSLGKWSNQPEGTLSTAQDASVWFRESGDNLCNFGGYEQQYSGWDQYGYYHADQDLCSMDFGLIYSCVGAYNPASSQLVMSCQNTLGGGHAPDLANPAAISAYALYTGGIGAPQFNEAGVISNERLALYQPQDALMAFAVDSDFLSGPITVCEPCTDYSGDSNAAFLRASIIEAGGGSDGN